MRFLQSGWDARIISKEPYVVGIGFAHTQEELPIVQKLLQEGGLTTVPKKVIIPENRTLKPITSLGLVAEYQSLIDMLKNHE